MAQVTHASEEFVRKALEAKQDKLSDGQLSNINNALTDASRFEPSGAVATEETRAKAAEKDLLDRIARIKTMTKQVVDFLPQVGEDDVLYLVPSAKAAEDNVRDEYLWINDKWEQVGSTSVDLSGYVKDDDPRLTNSRPPTSHTHTTSDITDLPAIPTVVAPSSSATTGQAADAKATGDALAGKRNLGDFLWIKKSPSMGDDYNKNLELGIEARFSAEGIHEPIVVFGKFNLTKVESTESEMWRFENDDIRVELLYVDSKHSEVMVGFFFKKYYDHIWDGEYVYPSLTFWYNIDGTKTEYDHPFQIACKRISDDTEGHIITSSLALEVKMSGGHAYEIAMVEDIANHEAGGLTETAKAGLFADTAFKTAISDEVKEQAVGEIDAANGKLVVNDDDGNEQFNSAKAVRYALGTTDATTLQDMTINKLVSTVEQPTVALGLTSVDGHAIDLILDWTNNYTADATLVISNRDTDSIVFLGDTTEVFKLATGERALITFTQVTGERPTFVIAKKVVSE